ncbi:hypothetical protein Tco_0114640, partial [Tanacetum coccineum]
CGFFQNTINSISKLPWCTVVVEDPNPPADEFEVCPLKEFLIKINVKNGQKPLTLDYKTVCETTRLDYNNGLYVDHPYTEVLGGNYSSTEQLNSIQQLLVFSLLTRTKIDIGKIIYSDHITRIMAKSRKKYVSYPRFISCALEELLGSKYSQDKSFRYFPSILKSSMTSLLFSEKKWKKKSQTVTQPKPKLQGPKALGPLP